LVSLEDPYQWPELDLTNTQAVVSTNGWEHIPAYTAHQLIHQAAEQGATWLSTLIYNSHIQWKPAEAQDSLMLDLLHRVMKRQHQLYEELPEVDHPASSEEEQLSMGDEAPLRIQQLLANQRYLVHESESFWNIPPTSGKTLRMILQAYRTAVEHMAKGDELKKAQQWLDSRSYELAAGKLRCEIGFADLLAKPLPKGYRKPQQTSSN
jgi:hypothetical protein